MKHEAEQFDLFQVEESLSPKAKWMNEHGVRVYHNPDMTIPFIAYLKIGQGDSGLEYFHKGHTEDEALEGVAEKAGVKLWNQ